MSTNENYLYLCDVISLLNMLQELKIMTLTEKGCHFFDSKSVNLFSTRQILCRYVGNYSEFYLILIYLRNGVSPCIGCNLDQILRIELKT